MDIGIVGGGITGLVTSATLAQRGHRVTLYEADSYLGGVLRDVVIGGHRYFRGCQYLPEQPEWFARLGLSSGLNVFDDDFRSYTDLGVGRAILLDGFGQPVFAGQHKFDFHKFMPSDAIECLNLYGDLSDSLINWAEGFNILDGLHNSNLNAMQLDRIDLPDMHDEVCRMKQDSRVHDAMFGVPGRLRHPDLPTNRAALPAGGYDVLINEILQKLGDLGVCCKTASPVTPFATKGGDVKFRVRKLELNHDLMVWCGNPTSLIYALSGKKLEASPVETTTLFGELSNLELSDPIYWQIFDKAKQIFRLFVWPESGRLKFAAEAKRALPSVIAEEIADFSAQIAADVQVDAKGHIDERRWINTSTSDFNLITGLKEKMAKNSIVSGAWEVFARESKLDQISTDLAEMDCL